MQISKGSKTTTLIIIFVALLILLFLSWLYVFNIYEVRVEVIDSSSLNEKIIKIIPVNSFGINVPCRKVDYSVNIIEGNNFIEKLTKQEDQISIKLVKSYGLIKLELKTEKTLNNTLIELQPQN